ncbi:hypothetical protein FHR24_001599 [Wenyingzhuangia heitensis]|uniref:Uncharacterized protein n=1 Tax=Wenyingzhuangia heitensis TaxID=1487859 RepID=A0ABX0UBF8_9FLAO|nr:hypothetical protein [Wenyingzhuangia heitensis]NIJ45160.1 hypothetical protein [Wenyingzhuangia heitensis]
MITLKTHISTEDFKDLASTTDFNCVSIYCPIHTGEKVSKNNLSLLITKVEQKLIAKGIDHSEAQNIIGRLEQILNNDSLWEEEEFKQDKTLIIFSNDNNIQTFIVQNVFDNCIHITSNYYLLPLFKKASNTQLIEDSLKIKQVVFNEDLTTNRLEKIIPLAFESKIARLYVSSKNGVYGVYDTVNKTTMIDNEKNNQNMSLINLAAITTYLYGGQVNIVDPMFMPTKGTTIQAILKTK